MVRYRYHDDDDAQVDGEGQGGPVQFQPQGAGSPWMRNPMPPWHLWGNTQRVEVNLPATGVGATVPGQLTRVSYNRPETWKWLFTARLIEADDATPGEPLQLTIIWELTVGIGRAVQQSAGFDNYNITWGTPTYPSDQAPNGRLIWTTETYAAAPGRAQFFPPGPEPLNRIDSIVAQDIQLNARVALLSAVTPRVPKRAVVELGCQWAPMTHIRPEWYNGGPPEVRFPGAETGGK